jgi:hypothetical protein
MWLVEVCRAAASVLLSNLAAPVEPGRKAFPMEDDPVGEFLARKEAIGGEMEDDEGLESEPSGVAGEEPELDSERVDGQQEAPAMLVEKTFEQEPVEQIALPVSELEDPGAADSGSWLEDTSQEDIAPDEIETETERVVLSAEELDSQEDGTENGSTADEPVSAIVVQREELERQGVEGEAEPQKEDEIDGLLEVFRSEELIENPLADLSRDMDDVSVYSLLEEIRSIAERVKKKQQ